MGYVDFGAPHTRASVTTEAELSVESQVVGSAYNLTTIESLGMTLQTEAQEVHATFMERWDRATARGSESRSAKRAAAQRLIWRNYRRNKAARATKPNCRPTETFGEGAEGPG